MKDNELFDNIDDILYEPLYDALIKNNDYVHHDSRINTLLQSYKSILNGIKNSFMKEVKHDDEE